MASAPNCAHCGEPLTNLESHGLLYEIRDLARREGGAYVWGASTDVEDVRYITFYRHPDCGAVVPSEVVATLAIPSIDADAVAILPPMNEWD